MKESIGNDQFSVKLLDAYNVFAGKTSDFSAMRIQSEPLFGAETAMFLMVVLAGLMGFLAGAFDKEDLSGVGLYVSVAILILVAVSTFRKRRLTTTLEASSKSVVLNRAGFLGSGFFSSKKEIPQNDIKGIFVERFAKGYFGGYGVQIKSSAGDKHSITNQNLEFEDAQKCAEALREFLKLEEKVLVTG